VSTDILDQIDHVLADYATGPDAMRWTPEPQPELARGGIVTGSLSLEDLRQPCRGFQVSFNEDPINGRDWVLQFPGGLPISEQWRALIYAQAEAMVLEALDRVTRVHSRPEPLAVDGAAYRRRQKARRRRRRA
jgi:hypothetical protein